MGLGLLCNDRAMSVNQTRESPTACKINLLSTRKCAYILDPDYNASKHEINGLL